MGPALISATLATRSCHREYLRRTLLSEDCGERNLRRGQSAASRDAWRPHWGRGPGKPAGCRAGLGVPCQCPGFDARSGDKLISETWDSYDQRGVFRVFFELLAQARYVNIDGSGERVRAVRPYFLQQHVP